jgi:hypothetical protein
MMNAQTAKELEIMLATHNLMRTLFKRFDALRHKRQVEQNAQAKCIKFQRVLRRRIIKKGPTMEIRN